MATTRNRRVKASPPVEEKPVEAPQIEEVKEAPKPVEKKAAAPKAKELSCRHAQHSHLGKGLILEEFTSNNKAYYKVKFENLNNPISVLQSRIIKE